VIKKVNLTKKIYKVLLAGVAGTHTTPVARYVDTISFTFREDKGACSLDGFSSSDVSFPGLLHKDF
jgi:hypothetical protein